MLVLIAGSIAIVALVGWALTRSVEPALPTAETVPMGEMPQSATAAPVAATTPATTPATATGSTASPTPPPEPNTGVPRISPDQLKELVDRGAVTVVDVRDSVSYTTGHIPGAVHIPFARVESESKYLPKDKPIVAYCT